MIDDWDDIRVFAAVVRTGSLSGAARLLNLTQPTVSRRIADLEEKQGFPLFSRKHRGMVLTEAGDAIWSRAEEMEACYLAITRQAAGPPGDLTGMVRLSVTEGLAALWLPPHLAAFRSVYPGIVLEIIADNTPADLAKRAADIAIRLARPVSETLVARRVGELRSALYAHADLVALIGQARVKADLDRYPLVDYIWADQRGTEGWREIVQGHSNVAVRTNSSLTEVEAIRNRLGVGLLPVYVETIFPEIVRVLPDLTWRPREIWLVGHRGVQQVPRMRKVYDYLVALLRAEARRLTLGAAAPPSAATARNRTETGD